MDNKFLDKVVDQIISETRINNDELYTPFTSSLISYPSFLSPYFFLPSSHTSILLLLSKHCKDIYSLNDQEIDYVWDKYKEGVTTLINDKEPSHQEKG